MPSIKNYKIIKKLFSILVTPAAKEAPPEEAPKTDIDNEEALKELQWLLSLSINTDATDGENTSVKSISAKGFSIVPQSTYILTVSRKGKSGSTEDEMIIPLTHGVKYDFRSNPEANEGYSEMLNKFLEERKDIQMEVF